MELPVYATWPVFKQIIDAFGFLFNFIFNTLSSMGITNLGVAIMFYALVYQTVNLFTPIRNCIGARKNQVKNRELTMLMYQYKGKEKEEEQAEYKEKQDAIKLKYDGTKPAGCLKSLLFLLLQLAIFCCIVTVINFPEAYVPALNAMSEAELVSAFTFLGADIRESAPLSLTLAAVIPVINCLLSFAARCVDRAVKIKESRAYEKELESYKGEMTEEEKEVIAEEEGKKKTFGQVMTKVMLQALNPLLTLILSSVVPLSVAVLFTADMIIEMANNAWLAKLCIKKIKHCPPEPIADNIENIEGDTNAETDC